MILGLAAGVEHHEKQQPEKSTSCLQATVPLMRMKGLGKGRVAGSHPAQHGGWHEGDIHMCSARTKPLQWLESQFPQMGAHCVTTVFPPSFDPFKLNGKTTLCCTQVDPLGSALTPGPREATRWGRARRVAAPGATSPKRRCSGSACSPSPRRQMSGTFASQFISARRSPARAGGQGEPAHAGKGEPGKALRQLLQPELGSLGLGAEARLPFGVEATRPRAAPAPRRSHTGLSQAAGTHHRQAHGSPEHRGLGPGGHRGSLHTLLRAAAAKPLRPRPTDGPGRGPAGHEAPPPRVGTRTRIPRAGEAAAPGPARTHPASAAPAPPPSSAPLPAVPVSARASPWPCRRPACRYCRAGLPGAGRPPETGRGTGSGKTGPRGQCWARSPSRAERARRAAEEPHRRRRQEVRPAPVCSKLQRGAARAAPLLPRAPPRQAVCGW